MRTIVYYTFCQCTSLAERFCSFVQTIADYAFYQCTSLVEVTIGRPVQATGFCMFYRCTSLAEMIADYALYQHVGLAEVALGGFLHTIGDYALHQCAGLVEALDGSFRAGDRAPGFLLHVTLAAPVRRIGHSTRLLCTGRSRTTRSTRAPASQATFGGSVQTTGKYSFH